MFHEHLNRQHRLSYATRGPEWAVIVPDGDLQTLEEVMRLCLHYRNGVGTLFVPTDGHGATPSGVERLIAIRPVDQTCTDAFAHADHAHVLAGVAHECPRAINSRPVRPSEVGRSTVTRALHGHPPADRVLVALGVWRYEGDAPRRELLRTLADGVLEDPFDLNGTLDLQSQRVRFCWHWARVI